MLSGTTRPAVRPAQAAGIVTPPPAPDAAAEEAPAIAMPAGSAASPPEEVFAPAAPTEAIDGDAAEAATAQAGVRVVPASQIDILPPEPAASEASDDSAVPVFRSAFWGEPEEGASGFAGTGGQAGALRDVQQEAAARAAMEDGSWLAALERDLFGAGSPQPEVPQPAPQPIETPQPQEDPSPPAQPIETPRPQEDPVPSPQPIVPPQPPEIPPVTPPNQPPTRADGELLVEDEVDSLGRREPKLY
jgi:hypothetical protein